MKKTTMGVNETPRQIDCLTQKEQILSADLQDARTRMNEYKELATHADRVILTTVCSDSRVVLPEGLVDLHALDGSPIKALFVGLPTIGGGAPSRSRLRQTIDELRSWGVDGDKLRILVTQHGDTDELEHSHQTTKSERITCGLRAFFEKYKEQLTEIRHRLIAWSDEYKQRTENITAAPDRMPLSVLEKECPDILELITNLSQETGPVGFRIPRRLIIRAAYRNDSFDMDANGESVRAKIAENLRHPEYEDIYRTCKVGLADYDHQRKILKMFNKYAGLDILEKEIELPNIPRRTDTIQSPQHMIISFGREVIPLHNGILFPHLARSANILPGQPPDNVFRACASIPEPQTALVAFAEHSYANLHKVHPHEGDMNFRDLEDCIVVCENDIYEAALVQMLQSDEWKEEYLPMFKKLNDGKLYVVNLHLDQNDHRPELHIVQL